MDIKQRYNTFPFNPAKIPFFYGWIILIAATIGILVSAPGQTTGVSTFTDYLIDNIGLSRTQLSTAYMVGTIGSSLILTFAGKMYDKYGARWVGLVISFLLAVVLFLLSQSDRIIKLFVSDSKSPFYVAFALTVLICLFFMLRFSGQGVLTMISRNMLMKWFIARRGFVNGISAVFVALGFSVAPLTFDLLIQSTSWRGAWIIMSIFIATLFSVFVFIFFRDNPEDLNMIPDGRIHANREHNVTIKPFRQMTLKEAKKTLSFWVFSIPMALYALYITAFTFHLVSIFENAGLNRENALSVFVPFSVISVIVSLVCGWVSDRIKLKYLMYFLLFGEFLALISLGCIGNKFFYYGFIIGNGITGGLYSVLMAVAWPRFYGRNNLGKITGFVMALIVFASALGPILLSLIFSRFGSYKIGFWGLSLIVIFLLFFSFKADNPQDKFISV